MKITLCGSCTFVRQMAKARDFLEKKGIEVFTPEPLVTEEFYQEKSDRKTLLKMKPVWTQNQFKKIQNADAVLIMNHEKKGIKGYIGSNTLMELAVAFFLGKKIFLLNAIEKDHPHYDEIIGVDSTTLHGDLNAITTNNKK